MNRLSIILPYYNPPPNWGIHVWEVYQKLQTGLGFSPELIVVNDGSLDERQEELLFLKDKIPGLNAVGYSENEGKGAALRYGVNQAGGKHLIYTDIDFPYTVESFLAVWKDLQTYDIVIGIKDAAYYHHLPKTRVWISKLLRKMIASFFRMPVSDTQCGLKGFNQKGKTVFLKTAINRYLCDLEFVYLSFRVKPKLRIHSRPVSLREGVVFGKMNTRVLISEFLNFLKILVRRKL